MYIITSTTKDGKRLYWGNAEWTLKQCEATTFLSGRKCRDTAGKLTMLTPGLQIIRYDGNNNNPDLFPPATDKQFWLKRLQRSMLMCMDRDYYGQARHDLDLFGIDSSNLSDGEVFSFISQLFIDKCKYHTTKQSGSNITAFTTTISSSYCTVPTHQGFSSRNLLVADTSYKVSVSIQGKAHSLPIICYKLPGFQDEINCHKLIYNEQFLPKLTGGNISNLARLIRHNANLSRESKIDILHAIATPQNIAISWIGETQYYRDNANHLCSIPGMLLVHKELTYGIKVAPKKYVTLPFIEYKYGSDIWCNLYLALGLV